MVDYDHEFWTTGSKYEELAKRFEQGIEYDRKAYDYVTSRRMCSCLSEGWASRCPFPLDGKVVRIEYRGESI